MTTNVARSLDGGSTLTTTGTPRALGVAWLSIAVWVALTLAGLIAGTLVAVSVAGLGGAAALLASLFLVAFAFAGSPILARGIVARRPRSARPAVVRQR